MDSSSSTFILVGIGLAIILGLLLLSGGGSDAPTAVTTPEPSASVGEEGSTWTTPTGGFAVEIGEDLLVGEREAVPLVATIVGAAGGAVTYRWTAQGALGFFSDRTGKETIYTSPSACDCEDCVLITVTAVDGRGVVATDTLVLTVRDPLACPYDPCVQAPVCMPTANPCAPTFDDPCPSPVVPCASPCIQTVEPVDPCTNVVVPCPCNAGDCESIWIASWPYPPTPGAPSDRPKPRIIRQFPSHIAEGSSFEVRGTISNPACTAACFTWMASKGILDDVDTLSPIYRAPGTDRPKGETVTITLVVYDGFGGRSYDQIRLTIDNLDYDGPRVP